MTARDFNDPIIHRRAPNPKGSKHRCEPAQRKAAVRLRLHLGDALPYFVEPSPGPTSLGVGDLVLLICGHTSLRTRWKTVKRDGLHTRPLLGH